MRGDNEKLRLWQDSAARAHARLGHGYVFGSLLSMGKLRETVFFPETQLRRGMRPERGRRRGGGGGGRLEMVVLYGLLIYVEVRGTAKRAAIWLFLCSFSEQWRAALPAGGFDILCTR